MTMTESDFEERLRRDLAELGALRPAAKRELRAVRRRRPAATVSVALLAVLALVAATVALVGGAGHRHPTVAPTPRVHTILEQPSAVTGLNTSIAATTFSEVCEKWHVLPGGIDCSDLNARFVWEPAQAGPYKFFVIEVIGTPDSKLVTAGAYPQHPVYESIAVRGHRARLFGDASSLTLTWQQKPDLQVWIQVSTGQSGIVPPALGAPKSLRSTIVTFADGMRPVVVGPAGFQYVLRAGSTAVEYAQTHTVRSVRWELTWRPRDRSLCMTADNVDECLAPVAPGSSALRAKGVSIVEECPTPWVGTQGLVFGVVPERTNGVAISFLTQGGHGFGLGTTEVVVPPGEPRLRVFAVALDHPRSAAVSAEDAAGRTIARVTLPTFGFTCTS
jgi:hypothetical protein